MFSAKGNENRCSFCGKGPFKNEAGLHRHISKTSTCREKNQHDFGTYASGLWEGQPTPQQREEPLREGSLDRLVSQEPPDFGLENLDIHLEDNFDINQEDEGITANVNLFPQLGRPIFMGEIGNERELDGRYIEDFNLESQAGAAWGQATPLFETLRLRQEEGGSRWDPFEDEEEWELAAWLIENVGQKKTDVFLKMGIVIFFSHCYKKTTS